MQAPTSSPAQRPADSDLDGLRLDGVSHRWRTSATPVLDRIHLEVPTGTMAWVGGRNGIGKTTLLRVAAGVLLAQQGTVSFRGASPQGQRRRYASQVGFLSAGDRGLTARLRVEQQLDLQARLAYVPREERATRVRAAMAEFGLDERAGQRVDRLSQGWRQRVRLAMALVHEPKLVLLDEPSNSLDDAGAELLARRIAQRLGDGASVLWCSPREDEGRGLAHRTYELLDGRLEALA